MVAERLPPVEPGRRVGAVAGHDAHRVERHAELVSRDLCEGGLVALPVGHLRGENDHGAVIVETHAYLFATYRIVTCLRAGRGLDVRRHPQSEVDAAGARFELLLAEGG